MKKLKIGVLTFHRCINYGSYWQASCLVEGLRERGHDAEIIDHENKRVNFAEWKCAFQPVLPARVPPSDHHLYKQKLEAFFCAFESLPMSPQFPLYEPEAMGMYDIVVVGSDEVWNLSHPWYGKCPLFYGEGIKAKRLVSYAASFGNYDAASGLGIEWASRLKNFASISVRDENSSLIVENSLGIKPILVLDPCLQFTISPDYRDEIFKGPYIAVYGHNFSPWFINQIKRWATDNGLPLISIGYRNDWADEQWIVADPHDFAHFMSRSKVVVTNFFHGCVFALRNAKSFVCETTPYRGNKLQGLITKTGSDKHLVNENSSADDYTSALSEPIDEAIIKKIDGLRASSNDYLDQALDIKNFS